MSKRFFELKRDVLPAITALHAIVFAVWLTIAVALCLSYFSIPFPGMGKMQLSPDFTAYYTAARLFFLQGSIYDVDQYKAVQEQIFHSIAAYGDTYLLAPLPFLNPPTSLLLLLPLVFFSFPVAFSLWLGINLLLSFVFLRGVISYFEIQDKKLQWLAAMLTLGGCFWGEAIVQGQCSLLLGTALIFFLHYARQGKSWLAALCLAILAIKPNTFFLLGLPVLFSLPRRFFWHALIVLLLSFILAAAIFSPAVFHDYLAAIGKVNQAAKGYAAGFEDMHNARKALFYFFGFSFQESLRWALIALAVVTSGLTLAWARLRPACGTPLFDGMLGLTVALNIFFSPWLHTHDLLMLVVPLGMLLRHYDWRQKGAVALMAVLYLLYVNFFWRNGWIFMQLLLIGGLLRQLFVIYMKKHTDA